MSLVTGSSSLEILLHIKSTPPSGNSQHMDHCWWPDLDRKQTEGGASCISRAGGPSTMGFGDFIRLPSGSRQFVILPYRKRTFNLTARSQGFRADTL